MAETSTLGSEFTAGGRGSGLLPGISSPGFVVGWTLFDLCIVGVAGVLSNWLFAGTLDISGTEALTIALFVVVAFLAFKWVDLHNLSVASRPLTQLKRAAVAVLATVMIVATIGYSTKAGYHISRGWMALWLVWILLLFTATRVLVAGTYARLEARDSFARRHVVFVSSPYFSRLDKLLSRWQASMPRSDKVVAVFVDDMEACNEGRYAWSHLVVGDFSAFASWAENGDIDHAVIAMPADDHKTLEPVLECVQTVAVDADLIAGEVDEAWTDRRVTKVAGLPCVRIMARPLDWGERRLKWLEDMVVASVALVVFAPVMAIAAIAIRLDSPGPVLFRQPRHGFNNRSFKVFKFRTMRHEPEVGESVKQATRDDDRVTRVGRFLRRTSLDELPQIFNVLRGEMSMVGPRPHAVQHNDHFARGIRSYLARHRVLPGITGWAQVNGFRGETDALEKMEDRVACDLFYVENWSLSFDIKILLSTFRCLAHPNAY